MKRDVEGQECDIDFEKIDFDTSYTKELKLICGSFYHDLARIFPRKMAAYVLLTRKSRRRLWCAYLAGIRLQNHAEMSLDDLRQKLLYTSAKTLLAEAFGDLPEGFLGVVKSPCVDHLGPDGFMLLYKVLSTGKVNPIYLHGHQLEDDLLEMLDAFPEEIAQIKIAKMFKGKRNFVKFQDKISFIEVVATKQLRESAYKQLLTGMKPETVVLQLLDQIAFPDPILSPCDCITYISTAADLFNAAQTFENCLRHKLPEALCGSHQFYIFDHADEKVLFAITKFAPDHWVLDEMQKHDEPFLSIEDVPRLDFYLEQEGIHTDRSTLYRALKSIMRA